MTYNETVTLKDGRNCIIRNGTEADGKELLEVFVLTHEETDFLTTYPDENTLTPEDEAEFLKKQTESKRDIELVAEIDGRIAGCAGIDCLGDKAKLRHRASFGISLAREYWGLGIGLALTKACIACAKEAGYEQLELEVVADNSTAFSLYQKVGFVEYGRNPKGFKSRLTGDQALIYMRLEL